MNDEDAFLHKLLENPADDTTRLVYADWLDEQGDPVNAAKSQFLRLTVRLLEPDRPTRSEEELQELAVGLDDAWLAVVSRLKLESCDLARNKHDVNELWEKYGIRFNVVCDFRWDELTPTDEPTVRSCRECQKSVHYCGTIEAARDHAWAGDCVAVSLGIIRHERDLERPMMMVGGIGLV